MITAKAVATPTIHKGTSAGIINGINIPETKNPSCNGWPLLMAKMNSIPSPTPYETIIKGSTTAAPAITLPQNIAP